ncbi:CaiB/BaiF CoA transferase family protein [Psychrobacillus soli]|uniref:CoA transferase n=1 Tax=Psychrobacillus soli TaxID=1543965 RepID=A0A544TKA4_9BACI|nr:CoA transferase [Psychrobacillus soli]TQR17880.1 CoA transferase [Psychrobacillus soli]
MKPLSGIRVLDFTHYIAGPLCCQTLADHGAEVIKIEPLNGEPSRSAWPIYEDISIYFTTMNRNKKGLALNLKSEKGQEVIKKLIETADILVTNYTTGVPEKLGIDYKTISTINPKISMVHITGFGLTGEKKDKRAFDGIIQALSGSAHLTGEKDGHPMKSGLFIADHIAGLQGVNGALLALQARERSGKGQLVDVAMLDSMVSMLFENLSLVSLLKQSPSRIGNRSRNVFSTTFPASDGYVYIAALSPKMWFDFCDLMGQSEWASENSKYSTVSGRLEDYDELENQITHWTKSKTVIELIRLLESASIPCGKVNSIEDVLNDKHLKDRNMLIDIEIDDIKVTVPGVVVKLSDSQILLNKKPPVIGENAIDILSEIGYSLSAIKSLYESGVINMEQHDAAHKV